MNKKERAKKILEILNTLYPEPAIPLNYQDNYTLLIAVMLSAQCTDARVNLTTPHLFQRASTPQEMIKLTPNEIEEIIRPCGLGPTKAKSIWNMSKLLLERFNGNVPHTFEELESLPGVGHKTASVVMAHAFHTPAFPIDTHIHRLAKRWGLSSGKNVQQTERDLKKLFPKRNWNRLHLQIIYFGREYCPARNHQPSQCPICNLNGIL